LPGPYGGSCSTPWHPRGVVRVEPVNKGWAAALAQGDDVFSERFAVAVEANWEGFPEVIRFLTEANRHEALSEWGLYLVFDDDGALVGNAGWKGEPINGAAELGYAVAPSRQGRGIATAVVRELVTRAVAAGLREVIAHTRAEESPSTSVLARCGFKKVDELVDPEDGPVWRWHLPLADQDGELEGVDA
jgi:ribosomal-protein-alanine N-acetyltransferase